jgi:hypothetical protein
MISLLVDLVERFDRAPDALRHVRKLYGSPVENSYFPIFSIETLDIRPRVVFLDLRDTTRRKPIGDDAIISIDLNHDLSVLFSIPHAEIEQRVDGAAVREASFASLTCVVNDPNYHSYKHSNTAHWNPKHANGRSNGRMSRRRLNQEGRGDKEGSSDGFAKVKHLVNLLEGLDV